MLGRIPLEPYATHLGPAAWLGSAPQHESEKFQQGWGGIGPDGVPIIALRNGFLIFNFPESDRFRGGAIPNTPLIDGRQIPPDVLAAQEERSELRYARFNYMNALLFALYSAYSTVQHAGGALIAPADPMNYFKAINQADKWLIFPATKTPVEFPGETQQCMSELTFTSALELMNVCKQELGAGFVELLNLGHLACHQYRSHQFSAAHVSAWCIAESMLQQLWKSYQASCNHTSINRVRRDVLNGRDYTASAVSQILSLAGILDDELLDSLDSARRARNAFAHSLAGISADQAGKAIACACSMISKVIGTPVSGPIGYSTYD